MSQATSKVLAPILGLVFIQVGGLTSALAEELPGLRLTLEHGQFFPKETAVQAPDPGERLQPTSDLGWISGSLELAPRHKIDFDYTNLAGDTPPGLDLHREFAYTLLDRGYETEADFNLRMLKVDYSYAFVSDPKWDLWGSLGLQVLDIDLRGESLDAGTGSFANPQWKPLPVLSLGGELNLASNWHLKGGIRYFDGAIGDWGGNVLDAKLSVEYSAFDRMGIGLSYDFMNIGLDRNRSGSDNYYGLRYDGVGIYARFSLD